MLETFRSDAHDRLEVDYIDSHGTPNRSNEREESDRELNGDTRNKLRAVGYIE
ncbi:MAG: hypothetical protein JRG89_13760 [Deltaproteobacteria bacterium]|nr:hypothetical protein [Deltaproteobacteria bacterium]